MTAIRSIPVGARWAWVDDQDYESLSAYTWSLNRGRHTWYAQRVVYDPATRRTVTGAQMHRQILSAPAGLQVDHRNGNGLDNRRCNLRLATHADNLHNTGPSVRNRSGYKGVHWHQGASKWTAQIDHRHLGLFDTVEAAAAAYQQEAERLHGEFAHHARST